MEVPCKAIRFCETTAFSLHQQVFWRLTKLVRHEQAPSRQYSDSCSCVHAAKLKKNRAGKQPIDRLQCPVNRCRTVSPNGRDDSAVDVSQEQSTTLFSSSLLQLTTPRIMHSKRAARYCGSYLANAVLPQESGRQVMNRKQHPPSRLPNPHSFIPLSSGAPDWLVGVRSASTPATATQRTW